MPETQPSSLRVKPVILGLALAQLLFVSGPTESWDCSGQRGYNYSDSTEDANEAQRVKKSVLARTARIRKPGSGNFPTLALASTL